MPRATTKLTDKEIKTAKTQDKDYVLSDGGGLQLRIRSTGAKQWNYNYTHPLTKKRVNISFGSYPEISLSDARALHIEARALVLKGVDPKINREEKFRDTQLNQKYTLKAVSLEWFEVKKDHITTDYGDDIWRSLERYIFPELGKTPIKDITAPMVIEKLRPLEAKGTLETVKRLCQRLNEIMTYAVNSGLIIANPLSGIREVFKKPRKEHLPALKPDELPELLSTLANANIKKTTRCLLEWQLHTMARPKEAAAARWDEIRLEEKLWIIPAERMKRRKAHTVPLSTYVLALLDTLQKISGHREYLFPSDKNPRTHCHSQTGNAALKRMGFGGRLVSHGFRSLASTTLNEQGFDPDVIEAALSHSDPNQIRSAYNRSDYLEKRREMMEWWSNHIKASSQGSLSIIT